MAGFLVVLVAPVSGGDRRDRKALRRFDGPHARPAATHALAADAALLARAAAIQAAS